MQMQRFREILGGPWQYGSSIVGGIVVHLKVVKNIEELYITIIII